MGAVIPGRFTAAVDGPFVVFIIGFGVNQLFAVRKWWPVASAMQPMLESLYRDPGKGFLAAESFIVPATGRRETARRRLGQKGEASVPTAAPPA